MKTRSISKDLAAEVKEKLGITVQAIVITENNYKKVKPVLVEILMEKMLRVSDLHVLIDDLDKDFILL